MNSKLEVFIYASIITVIFAIFKYFKIEDSYLSFIFVIFGLIYSKYKIEFNLENSNVIKEKKYLNIIPLYLACLFIPMIIWAIIGGIIYTTIEISFIDASMRTIGKFSQDAFDFLYAIIWKKIVIVKDISVAIISGYIAAKYARSFKIGAVALLLSTLTYNTIVFELSTLFLVKIGAYINYERLTIEHFEYAVQNNLSKIAIISSIGFLFHYSISLLIFNKMSKNTKARFVYSKIKKLETHKKEELLDNIIKNNLI